MMVARIDKNKDMAKKLIIEMLKRGLFIKNLKKHKYDSTIMTRRT